MRVLHNDSRQSAAASSTHAMPETSASPESPAAEEAASPSAAAAAGGAGGAGEGSAQRTSTAGQGAHDAALNETPLLHTTSCSVPKRCVPSCSRVLARKPTKPAAKELPGGLMHGRP